MGRILMLGVVACAASLGWPRTHTHAQRTTSPQGISALRVSSVDCGVFDDAMFAKLLVLELLHDQQAVDGRVTVRIHCDSDLARIRTSDANARTQERLVPRPAPDEPESERVFALATAELLQAARWTRARVPDAPIETEVILQVEAEPPVPSVPEALAHVETADRSPAQPVPNRFRFGLGATTAWHVPGRRVVLFGAQARFSYRIKNSWWLVAAATGEGRRVSGFVGDIGLAIGGLQVGAAWTKLLGDKFGWDQRLLLGTEIVRLKGRSSQASRMAFNGHTRRQLRFGVAVGGGPYVALGDWSVGVEALVGVMLPRLKEQTPTNLVSTPADALFTLGPTFVRAALVLERSFR